MTQFSDDVMVKHGGPMEVYNTLEKYSANPKALVRYPYELSLFGVAHSRARGDLKKYFESKNPLQVMSEVVTSLSVFLQIVEYVNISASIAKLMLAGYINEDDIYSKLLNAIITNYKIDDEDFVVTFKGCELFEGLIAISAKAGDVSLKFNLSADKYDVSKLALDEEALNVVDDIFGGKDFLRAVADDEESASDEETEDEDEVEVEGRAERTGSGSSATTNEVDSDGGVLLPPVASVSIAIPFPRAIGGPGVGVPASQTNGVLLGSSPPMSYRTPKLKLRDKVSESVGVVVAAKSFGEGASDKKDDVLTNVPKPAALSSGSLFSATALGASKSIVDLVGPEYASSSADEDGVDEVGASGEDGDMFGFEL